MVVPGGVYVSESCGGVRLFCFAAICISLKLVSGMAFGLAEERHRLE